MKIPTADIDKIYETDQELKKADIQQLKDWISKQFHLPEVSELQLILFLQSCYYSIESAKHAIDNYFTVKTLCKETFGNRNPQKNPSVQAASNCVAIIPMNHLTNEGFQVLWCRLMDFNSENFNFANQIRNFDMVEMLQLHQFGPQKGLILVFDMKGCTFGHLTKMSNLEAMPIRLKGLHYVNVVSILDKFLALMKPFMKKELLNMLFIHANNSMESLFEYVQKECFPADYGGLDEPLNILHEKMKLKINENEEYFTYEDGLLVDEKLRPSGKLKNINDFFGMEGSFKKLEVD